MDKHYVDSYLNKLTELDEEEKKNRMLYLKKLNNGDIQGPLTNIPFFDQDWLINYEDNSLTAESPKMNMYEFLYQNNKDNLDDIAIIFPGIEITYGELFNQIDKYADSLIQSGLKEGDSVALPLPTTPESIYLFYAILKIGCIANLIDLRKDVSEINYALNKCNSKMLFTLDIAKNKLLNAVKDTTVEEVISLSATESLPTIIQLIAGPQAFMQKIKDTIDKNRNYFMLKEFLGRSKGMTEFPKIEYKKDRPSFVVYTSGTTAKSKAVELTADTANNKVFQYMNNGMEYERQDVYLNVIPLFLAFGSIIGLHLPLCMGMKDVIVPQYEIEKTAELFKKYRPNHVSLTPQSYRELVNSKIFSQLDLSNVKTWGCGGDGFSAEEEKIINEQLKKQGSKNNLNNGYGASEIGAPFATQKNDNAKAGTTGNPLPGNNVIIFEHGTRNILEKNCVGDICMIVDNPMTGYVGNQELTEKTKIDLGNGTYGIMLNDAGFIDDEGNLVVKGRYVDAIYDDDNNIIWPIDIENIAMSTGLLKNSAAIALDEKNSFALYIVLNDRNDEIKFKQLFEQLLIMNRYEKITYQINCLDKMLLNPNGKVDKARLKENYNNYLKKVII